MFAKIQCSCTIIFQVGLRKSFSKIFLTRPKSSCFFNSELTTTLKEHVIYLIQYLLKYGRLIY
jgi:hypothetical protein